MVCQQQEADGKRVWGAAYHIKPEKVKEVKEYLDIREINGYSIDYTRFWPTDSSVQPIQCLVYIGLPNNPQFLGVQTPDSVAKVISERAGPSGENREYLFELEEALLSLGPESHDAHIADLASRVRILIQRREMSNINMHVEHNEHQRGTLAYREDCKH